MEISVRRAEKGHMPRPESDDTLGFGKYFTNHMFLMDYKKGAGWHNPRIEPYGPFSLDPAAVVLHYGQEVFEGLKAYRSKRGIALFRPDMNIRRMNRSAVRICMPEIDEEVFFQAMTELVLLDQDWIPHKEGCSLYIRPTMIATEAFLGVRPATEYLFYIIIGPVGAYYPEGFKPTRMYVTEEYVRAVRGGVGEAKTSGNYAASLYAAQEAIAKGYTQVLWLDAVERRYVEEVGTSNVFFLIRDELVTPPLSGSILPGVTRDSVIDLARKWGISVSERPVAIDEVVDLIRTGDLKEVFASGTAAVISPVGSFQHRGTDYTVADGNTGALSKRLYDTLTGIQYGTADDPFGWVRVIG